jgi:hypothetical protein
MRILKVGLMIVAVVACFYAVVWPATYAFLFAFFGDGSGAFLDIAVAASCVILLADIFRSLNIWLFSFAIVALLAASFAGFFFHFRASDESGPLPYEWLNYYYVRSAPLLLVSAGVRLFRYHGAKQA